MRSNVNPLISGRMTIDEVLALLLAECEKAGGRTRWARLRGLSAAYVSDVLNRRREPGRAILAPLGVEKTVTYRKVRKEDRHA